MYFEFRDVGNSTPVYRTVPLLALATNVISDWHPNAPPSVARGFNELLSRIIVEDSSLKGSVGSASPMWRMSDAAGTFEKQWKQVTSWMVGAAFCRFIADSMGYTWWAPVSAFTNPTSKIRVSTPEWHPSLPPGEITIKYPAPKLSNLYPDYLLARVSGNGLEFALAESKGSERALASLHKACTSWANQSKNAEIYRAGTKIPIKQNLVVATRVNPNAKWAKTRQITVRAWNSSSTPDPIPFESVRHFFAMHYFGICMQIGLSNNAELIRTASNLRQLRQSQRIRRLSEVERSQLTALEEDQNNKTDVAFGELNMKFLSEVGAHAAIGSSEASTFNLGNTVVRLGLTEGAARLLRTLQNDESEISSESIKPLAEEMKFLKESTSDNAEVYVRGDGVIAMNAALLG